MNLTTEKITIKDKLLAEFELNKNALFGDKELRQRAIKSFERLGIPNRKNEEYKYINIEALLKSEFTFTLPTKKTEAVPNNVLFDKDAIVLVLLNGKFSKEHSRISNLPKEVFVESLAEAFEVKKEVVEKHYAKYADPDTDSFIALNTALASDGAFIYVAENSVVEKCIHVLNLVSVEENTFINTRNLFVIAKNAQVKIVEHYESIPSSVKTVGNFLTEIFVDETANVEHYKIQNEGEHALQVNTTQVSQQKNSVFSTNTITVNGSLVRNNLNVVLEEERTESHLYGLCITNGEQVVDNHTMVDHRKPNCNSNELYKNIIEGKSSVTFNGKVFVRKDAQKTNAFQSNKNILLSDDATINTKPQLEIYADDVKCSHGTSTGKMDEEALFYLQARGIGKLNAQKLLMYAFAEEVVDAIKIPGLKEYIENLVSKRFE